MYFLFSLAVHNVTRYCLRMDDAELPQCPEEVHKLNTIDEFYNVLEPNAVADLLVINNPKTELLVDSKLLKNSAIDFTGIPTSVINFTLADQQHTKLDNIGFKNITVKLDSQVNFGFANFYLINAKFSFTAGQVTLKAKKITTDLGSISYFDEVRSTEFHLTSTDILPKGNTTIYVLRSLTVEAMSSESRVDIGVNQLQMDFDKTIINFLLNNTASCLIEHNEKDTLMDVYIDNVERLESKDSVFTINATNGALVDIQYKQYIEDSSPQLRVYLSGNAVLTSTSHNSPCAIIAEGDCKLNFKESHNDLSFLSLTVTEGANILIDNPKRLNTINFIGFVVFYGNGALRASNPININVKEVSFFQTTPVDNFLDKISLKDVHKLETADAESVVPSLTLAEDAIYNYNFNMDNVKMLTINNFEGINKANLIYTGGNIPSDEKAQPFVDNDQYIISSDSIDCQAWETAVESTGNFDGFTQETSIFKPVCKVVEGKTLAGFKFIDTPMHVYPWFCYGSLCSDEYIVNDETASTVGSLVQPSARRVFIMATEDMPDAAAFSFEHLKYDVVVEVYSITTNTRTNIRMNKYQMHITELELTKGLICFTKESEIKIPLITFGQGCVITHEQYSNLHINETTKIAIDFDALDTFPLTYFPNAIVPIREHITVRYTNINTLLISPRFPDTPTYVNNFTQIFEIEEGGGITLDKEDESASIDPIKVLVNNKEIKVDIMSWFREKDVALDFVGIGNITVATKSQRIPFMFTDCNVTVSIGEAPGNFVLNQKLFKSADINVVSETNKFILPNSVVEGNLTVKGKNVEIEELQVKPNATLHVQEVKFQKDFTIPVDAKIISKASEFANKITIESSAVGKSGVLNVDKPVSLPEHIDVTWTAHDLPENDISLKSYVIISKDSVASLIGVTEIDATQRTEGKREVSAELLTDKIGIYIQYDSSYKSNKALYVGLISAGSVAAVAIIVIIIGFCCCRRTKSGEARLLSAETLITYQATV